MLDNDFNFLQLIEAHFVAQCAIYPRECSMCTCEECVYSVVFR